MKRKVKSSLSMFLIATMLVVPTTVEVYAADTTKIINTEVALEETYFIKDDSSLWKSNDDGTFTKIGDNILAVYPDSEWGDCAYITKDNTLIIYEYNSRNGKGVTSEVAKNVKSVQFTEYESYYLTTGGELYECTFKYKNHFDNSYKFSTSVVAEDVQAFATDAFSLWYIDSNNDLWYNEYMYYPEDAEIVFENVKDIKAGSYSAYVLDLAGNLYYIDEYYWGDVEITTDNIVATDVKAVEIGVLTDDFEESINAFIIKNDNSLWGKGTNTNGQFGVEFGTSTTEEFTKIASDVVDVDTSATHTTYITKDGKLWGMGNNNKGQLGSATGDKVEAFDNEGFVEIATGVEIADLYYDITTYKLEDGSLWGLGNNYSNVFSNTDKLNVSEPILIAEDVKWWNTENTGDTIPYVVGEDRALYYNGINYGFEIGQTYQNSDVYRELYEFYFDSLGLDITFDYYIENKEEVENLMNEASYNLTAEEEAALTKKQDEFVLNFLNESNAKSIATGVVQSSEEYFVDTNNDLYIINENNEAVKIRSDVKTVFTENEYVLIVDTNDKLYIADAYEYVRLKFDYEFDWSDYKNDLEPGDQVVSQENTRKGSDVVVNRKINDLNFLYTGITGVAQIEGLYDDTYVLKNDGTLVLIQATTDYIYIDNDGEYSGKVSIEYEDFNYRDVADDFEEVEIEDDTMYYGYEGEYSSYWSGYLDIYNKEDLLVLGDMTFKITNLATGAKNFDVMYDQLVYVDKNDILWANGDNSYGQLLNDGEDYYSDYIKIADDVKMAGIDGCTLILLKNDGTLLGRGLNNSGELGIKEIGYYYNANNIFTPKQIQ